MSDSSLSLALAFYRAPFEYQELRQAQFSLPADTDHLLRIAGGNAQNLSDLAQDANLDELREAAIFFIQQIFFTDGANHYRVLGLNPGADQKRIKDHHRLLIRLFHPDRQQPQEVWTEVYAERVNEAYNVLRKPDLRRAYDAALTAEAEALAAEALRSSPRSATTSNFASHTVHPKISTRRLPRFFQRNLPQTLLAGSALVAALLVFGVYLSNHPGAIITLFSGKKQTVEPLPAEASIQQNNDLKDQFKTAVSNIEQHLAQIETKSEPSTPTAASNTDNTIETETVTSTVNSAVIESKPSPIMSDEHGKRVTANIDNADLNNKDAPAESVETAAQTTTPSTVAHTIPIHPAAKTLVKDSFHRDNRQQTLKQKINKESEHKKNLSVSTKAPPSKPVAASPEKSTVVAMTRKKTPEVGLTKTTRSEVSGVELEILTSLFIGAYERGNIEELMTLFDERANANNKTGKSNIRQEYESFFVKTLSRQMNLRQLRWQKNGLSASGRGLYQVQVKGDQGIQNYTGTIRFEVKKKNKRVLITKLSHKALF